VPKEGQAFLVGIEEYAKLPTILADTALLPTFGLGMLLMLVGNVILGVAVWRSGTLPKWAGALWVAGSALPMLGMFYALLPIGANATPPTVPAGAVLLVIGGAWMALSVLSRPSAATVGVGAQPRVQ
jgi:hypothetical protein